MASTISGSDIATPKINVDSGTLFVDDVNDQVGIGTSSPVESLEVRSGNVKLAENSVLYNNTTLDIRANNGRSTTPHALELEARGPNDRIAFKIDTTEAMRIDSSGNLLVGTTSTFPGIDNLNLGFMVQPSGSIFSSKTSNASAQFNNNSGGAVVVFRQAGSLVGTISVTSSSTSYNTSSDYRLKENVTELSDGIERLKHLPVHRFNFIADPDNTVDGFLAHEVQPYVPEAVTGEKDAVDEDGNPEYQGIDQAKLVPVLTAALQEAVAEIESLKERMTQLENGTGT